MMNLMMNLMIHVVIGLKLLVLTHTAMAGTHQLLGTWQHESDPVVVVMQPVNAAIEGVVISNENKPEAAGVQLFRNLVFSAEHNCWQGEVYAPKLDEYKDTCLLFIDDNKFEMTVKVGFFSKTISWTRQQPVAASE